MGVGHVPAGPLREERAGDDLSRRQHRGARALLGSLDADARRKALGSFGEHIAARFLTDRGAKILSRNRRVGRGELDLVVAIDGVRVAVEVKTGTAAADPIHHFNAAKATQVRSLASRCGVHRVDYIGVAVSPDCAVVRWLPGVG